MDNYLIIRKMNVTEANMDAAPIVVGSPSIPAVMGFAHALERLLQSSYPGVLFTSAGISCHSFQPGIHNTGEGTKVSMTRNPPYEQKHLEKGVPFIEEGKADMQVSLILRIEGESFDGSVLRETVEGLLPRLRFSGGTIWKPQDVIFRSCPRDDEPGQKKILKTLMPGFVLQERRDLVEKSMENGLDVLDAVLDHLELRRVDSEQDDVTDRSWERKSGEAGWLVPIVVGYRDISGTLQVPNQRDPECAHCFAENVITLGEYMMPIRLDRIDSMLWKSYVDPDHGLYLYTQHIKT